MPIYDYECEACGQVFEVIQAMSAKAPACPECGAKKTKRLVGGANFSTAEDGTAARVEGEIKKRLGQGRAVDALRLAEKASNLAGNKKGMGKIKAARDKLRGHLTGR